MKISGIVITLNEEEKIRNCIRSLQKVCEEVIVIDSNSSDQTVNFAQEEGAFVFCNPYPGEGLQKQLAVSKCKNDWILCLDADELVDDDMAQAILNLKLDSTKETYSFKRKNIVGQRWIRAGGFYPDAKTRLFNKQSNNYNDRVGHATISTESDTLIEGHIVHHTYKNLDDWMEKINWFVKKDSKQLFEKGMKASSIRPFARAIIALLRKLLLKRCLFQGRDGWLIATTTAYRTYMKYERLNELHDNQAT